LFYSSGCYKDSNNIRKDFQIENNSSTILNCHHVPAKSAVIEALGVDKKAKKSEREKIINLSLYSRVVLKTLH
jgi:hypothetical protein